MDFAWFVARTGILREYVAQYGGAIGQEALVDAESNLSCDQDHVAVREPEFFIMLPSSLVSDRAYLVRCVITVGFQARTLVGCLF